MRDGCDEDDLLNCDDAADSGFDEMQQLRDELAAAERNIDRKNEIIFRLDDEIDVLRTNVLAANRRLVVFSQRELMVLSLIDGVDSGGRVMTVSELSKHIRTLLTVEDD